MNSSIWLILFYWVPIIMCLALLISIVRNSRTFTRRDAVFATIVSVIPIINIVLAGFWFIVWLDETLLWSKISAWLDKEITIFGKRK